MIRGAHGVIGVAILLALLLLMQVASGGALALGAAALVLALSLPRGAGDARSRAGLGRSMASVLGPVLAVSVGVGLLLRLALAAEPPPGLAWFARVLCLASATLLSRTPAPALVLHGLVVILAVWTAAVLHPTGDASPLTVGLTLATVAVTVHALLTARSLELSRVASGSLTIGVAPQPWGLRRQWGPSAVVALLAAVPVALGISLPRPVLGPGVTQATRGPGPRLVEFTSSVRLDQGHAGLVQRPEDVVARARVSGPQPPELLLRGSALPHAREAGFFQATTDQREPTLREPTQTVRLEVELLRSQEDHLFVLGRPGAIEGVASRRRPWGHTVEGDPSYPLRYTVDCEEVTTSLFAAQTMDDPALLALPTAIANDQGLRAYADEIAWGRDGPTRARAAMRWFEERCVYDADHPIEGSDLAGLVKAFLATTGRRGICVEFAATMAVLLRLVEVPARLVTGYRTYERDDDGRFVIRARHAHVWVEVPIEGGGWIPLDPTPGLLTIERARRNQGSGREQAAASTRSWRESLPVALGVLALLALAFGLRSRLGLRRSVRAAQLGRDAVESPRLLADRARLFALLEARGFSLGGSETPLEFLDVLEAVGPIEPELEEAVGCYTGLRFSGQVNPDQEAVLRRCLRRLR